jgi:hypothetical protein
MAPAAFADFVAADFAKLRGVITRAKVQQQ